MRRSTVVMIVLLVVLAGLYWYMQQPENLIARTLQPTPTATRIEWGNIISPEKGQPTRIVIESAEGQALTLDKSSGIWFLTVGGTSGPADPNKVESVVAGLTTLRILSNIQPAPELTSIALEPPAYRVSVTMSDGSTVDFHIGSKTVIQSGYYVRTADGNLYVTAAYNIDALLNLMTTPPFLQTATPSPQSVTETPSPRETPSTPQPTATP
ncbi:MAG: hypothetical protein DDG60_07625 [Anaerolineae bacterium]|nr:MAG: hypothetical protein DDG60_07625 [Anaerolineae bacterium]